VPIGRPIANTKIYLLDGNLAPVPVGVPGEIHIGGDGLARGYLGDPVLTAAKFISHALPGLAPTRLYRTGDIACYLPDGKIDLLGRNDEQVKIRGYRVELGELEAVLLQYPAVAEAAVAVGPGPADAGLLIAFLVPATEIRTNDVRNFLQERLPDHAIPTGFILMESLPRLPNGKLDRRHLSAVARVETAAATADDEWTDLERSLSAIWREVLKIERIARTDDFFRIGGNSLSIIRVHNRLRELTDREVSITDLFKYPTIQSLAGFLGGDVILGEIA
jgi:acyl-CoA synthetase (AMP-forming)/AMP-acid ligase II/acyl carrier protein